MLTSVRMVTLICALLSPAVHPQVPPALSDTTGLEFLGFRAGAGLGELAAHLQSQGGPQLRCRQSRMDPRVHDCHASLRQEGFGGPVALWISAVDTLAGVMMLSAAVETDQLTRWRTLLEEKYGRVGTKVQGTQSMLQWVRRGRMLRLTWRVERGRRVASVSLVDGRVLDSWGRSRAESASRALPGQPVSRTK
jgi:hypothetical protein